MTAENDGRGRYSGDDALMAAIIDEPLPDEIRADAAFMAEHQAAVADVALLREQLGIIGRALGEPPAPAPEPKPEPAPLPVRQPSRVRRRVFAVAFGALAVTAVASVMAGLGWLVSQSGGADTQSAGGSADKAAPEAAAGSHFGTPRYLACARLVAEGEVTAVVPVPGAAQERITLRVTRSYQPEKSGREVTFVMEEDALHKGEQVLVGIPRHAAGPDVWIVGEQDIALERNWITASLPEAREMTC